MERRENPRMDVRLECTVGAPGSGRRAPMVIENISRKGALMIWDNSADAIEVPAPGDLMHVEIQLPAHHVFGRKCMFCDAQVVRISNGGGQHRVAMKIRHMEFRACRHANANILADTPETTQ